MTLQQLQTEFACKGRLLTPFGLLLEFDPTTAVALTALPCDALKNLVLQHRLIVMRGILPIDDKDQFSESCERFGPLLTWDFGALFEVVEHDQPKNYLFTNGSVPYHWDGAFAEQAPWLQVFQCREAPSEGVGGETLFCDTAAIWKSLTTDTQQRWRSVEISYFTEKVSHYGGVVRAALVAEHPLTNETVLRFAEPANETTVPLNTPLLEFHGIDQADATALLKELTQLIYDPQFVYAHAWRQGEYLLADNHVLLHGRSRYHQHQPRRLWRVHVL